MSIDLYSSHPALILMVEDNFGDVVLMKRAFRQTKLPHDIVVATSGEQALSILRQEGDYAHHPQPDLILLDLNLPRMSGKDVLRTVKQDATLKHIPVVVVSSSSAVQEVRSCYELYANSYIVKPATLEQYVAILHKIDQYWFNLTTLPHKL